MDDRFGWVRSELFPFTEIPAEGDPQIRPLDALVVPEPPRGGELGPEHCRGCALEDEEFIWVDERWRLSVINGIGVPLALSLQPRAHLDSPDLDEQMAGELGSLLVRIERAMLAAGDLGRVHFSKWCDGGAHLHWWILGRPLGALQQRGSYLILWAQVLAPPPPEEVAKRAHAVALALTETAGWCPQSMS
ncbi:MAG: hypothetical protein ACT452_00060 [Microthrixaceae bacterium]